MTLGLVAALLFAQSYYTPDEAQALFREGNDAFYKDPPDYAAAKAAYLKLLEHGHDGPDVLFNLGTACLANGELGPAVLYLERARRLKRADDIETNLAAARARQGDQLVGGVPTSAPFFERVADATDDDVVSALSLGSLWLTLGLALLFRRLVPGRRGWATFLLVMSIITAAVTTSLVGIDVWVQTHYVEGVVMPDTARVRDFPGDSARVAFEVHAGLKVRIMEESGKFVRIRLSNNLEGWVDREGVTPL
ncbi:MAG: SH3 domain-containing protein [Myxococcaceae bacterium]|nr:SH3 domain-containing protein [Myxococcaceae bacterium]